VLATYSVRMTTLFCSNRLDFSFRFGDRPRIIAWCSNRNAECGYFQVQPAVNAGRNTLPSNVQLKPRQALTFPWNL
jgi:hypothetical protein